MKKGIHKRQSSEGIVPAPSKKLKVAAVSPVCRSSRVGKGSGGATEQLKKVGEAVMSGHRKKPDPFTVAGEVHNPMVPEGQGTNRTGDRKPPRQHVPAPKLAKSNERFGFKLPADDAAPRSPSLTRGLMIIAEERKRQHLKAIKTLCSARNEASKSSFEDAETLRSSRELECLPGDKDSDSDEEAIPGERELESSSGSDKSSDDSEPGSGHMEGDGFDGSREFEDQGTDNESQREGEADQQPSREGSEDVNVLEAYYSRNRRPQPPSPARLLCLQQRGAPGQQNAAVDDNEESDNSERPTRQIRYSKNAKQEHCTDPTQLGFYPPKWMDFLEDCKVETRTYAAVRDPWPQRKAAMQGFISEAITMTIQKWRRKKWSVERGYYPKHHRNMCKLLFEDLSSWHGELKKAAASLVRAHYDIFPPLGNRLSKVETHRHVKHAANNLIKKASFAHSGRDPEGHTNNFGHRAIQELVHTFFYGREKRIGNIHPEFGTRIPKNVLTLVVTAIRCILNGYSLHGNATFPYFSRDNYRLKWKKYNELVIRLEEHEIHGRKFEQMCREIMRTGLASGVIHRDAEDGDGSDHEDYGITLD